MHCDKSWLFIYMAQMSIPAGFYHTGLKNIMNWMEVLTYISVKLVNLASSFGNSPEKAFEDRVLQKDNDEVQNISNMDIANDPF